MGGHDGEKKVAQGREGKCSRMDEKGKTASVEKR